MRSLNGGARAGEGVTEDEGKDGKGQKKKGRRQEVKVRCCARARAMLGGMWVRAGDLAFD
jgi:hypothetical protein